MKTLLIVLFVAGIAAGLYSIRYIYWVEFKAKREARRKATTYYTVDGGKLCPYPGMTDEELKDFEEWVDEMTRRKKG